VSIRLKAILAVIATAATFALLFVWRGFFLQHAALVALAVGALVYTTLGTTERLGRTYRRKGPRSVSRRDGD
jgi:hypothetical protein